MDLGEQRQALSWLGQEQEEGEAVGGVSACRKLTKFGQSDMPPAVISLLGIKWVEGVERKCPLDGSNAEGQG